LLPEVTFTLTDLIEDETHVFDNGCNVQSAYKLHVLLLTPSFTQA
jgi:hypothetical protein